MTPFQVFCLIAGVSIGVGVLCLMYLEGFFSRKSDVETKKSVIPDILAVFNQLVMLFMLSVGWPLICHFRIRPEAEERGRQEIRDEAIKNGVLTEGVTTTGEKIYIWRK